MIEITMKIDNIDHEGLAKTLLPLISQHLSESDNRSLGTILSALSRPGSIGGGAAMAILSKMSPEAKDELVVKCLNAGKEQIIRSLEQAAANGGFALEIKEADVRRV